MTRLEGTDRHARPTVAWPRRVLAEVVAAIGFLTRLPVGEVAAANPERTGAAAFALVGAAMGTIGAMALLVLGDRAPLAAGGLAVGAMAVVSGALHLDGLADTADALAASVASGRPAFVLGAVGGIAIGVLLASWLAILRKGLDGDALGALVEVGFAAILLVIVVAL